jgi:hypothetical protein
VKKRKTILDFRKQKENHRIGGRDFCYCFAGSPSFTPPIATNRSRNPSRKRRLLCLSFPVLSSLFCVQAAARRQKRDGETEERERWRAGHLLRIVWLFSIVYAKNEKIGLLLLHSSRPFFVMGISCNVETRDSLRKKYAQALTVHEKDCIFLLLPSVIFLCHRTAQKRFLSCFSPFFSFSSVLSIDFFRFFACANLKNFRLTWKFFSPQDIYHC